MASNLPEGAGGGGNQSSETSETTETTRYEISETLTTTESLPGKVLRMSVAVLLDHKREVAEDGMVTFVPRTEEELEVLRELASAAAGLDTNRGDVLRVDTLAFDRPEPGEMVTLPGAGERFIDQHGGRLAQLLILSLLALGLGFLVVRPLLRASRGGMGTPPALIGGALEPMSLGDSVPELPALEGGGFPMIGDMPADGGLGLPAPDPKAELTSAIGENMDDAAALLASWLDVDPSNKSDDPELAA